MSGDLAKVRGFYAVLDRDDPAFAEMMIASGARVVQVRMKRASAAELARTSSRALEVTRARGALLVVNDRLDVALAVGADAVHLGQDDVPLADARRIAGPRLLIGVSTHDVEQVRAAVAGGADYLGFGPVYSTGTKENPDPVQGTAGLARAVAAAGRVPVVAIGGITVLRAAEVAATGAAAACAIAAVNGAKDPEAAARAIACAFGPDWNRARTDL